MANKNANKNVGTNYVTVTGKMESDLEFSHKSGNKSFYMTKIAVKRLSDVEDHIQLIVPETLRQRIMSTNVFGYVEIIALITIAESRKTVCY